MPKLHRTRYLISIDLLLVVTSMLLAIYVLPKGKDRLTEWGIWGIVASAVIWFVVSYICKKYSPSYSMHRRRHIFLCNLLIVGLLMLFSYIARGEFVLRNGSYFLFVLITVVELVFFRGVEEVSRAIDISTAERYFRRRRISKIIAKKNAAEHEVAAYNKLNIYEAIKGERGAEVADYLSSIERLDDERLFALGSESTFALRTFPEAYATSIINIRRLNNTKHLNTFFKLVNDKLTPGGHLLCCVEIKNTRKKRILSRYPWGIKWLVYSLDYIFKRIFPKLRMTRGLYFLITRGYNRILTYTEMLGRLYASGFELMSEKQIGDLHYLQLCKVAEADSQINRNYGMLIKLPRVGKGGEMINVYKMRTMHPYSEYIQAYVYDNNGSRTGDKLENDFRVNSTGKFFRRFWIDELPMILNLLKGQLKLVGVRPLSRHKYETYPDYLQEKRIKTKPGLVPPYYADMPKMEEELWDSENRYLDAYLKNPWRTDWRYFWKAMHNIIIKGERSS